MRTKSPNQLLVLKVQVQPCLVEQGLGYRSEDIFLDHFNPIYSKASPAENENSASTPEFTVKNIFEK